MKYRLFSLPSYCFHKSSTSIQALKDLCEKEIGQWHITDSDGNVVSTRDRNRNWS